MRLIGAKVCDLESSTIIVFKKFVYDSKSTYIDMSVDIFCYTKKINTNVDKFRISIDRLEGNGYNLIV